MLKYSLVTLATVSGDSLAGWRGYSWIGGGAGSHGCLQDFEGIGIFTAAKAHNLTDLSKPFSTGDEITIVDVDTRGHDKRPEYVLRKLLGEYLVSRSDELDDALNKIQTVKGYMYYMRYYDPKVLPKTRPEIPNTDNLIAWDNFARQYLAEGHKEIIDWSAEQSYFCSYVAFE